MGGRTVALMANDSTVKAGSWGARTVEKILRIQETARSLRVPLLYLVDSAGARITDQAEMFLGEKVTLEEMGGARMHCSVSGCGDVLVKTEDEAIAAAKAYLSYFPSSFAEQPPVAEGKAPARSGKRIDEIIPADQNKPFDMFALINEIVDAGSLFEVKKLFAQEVITVLARIDGRPVGIVANQPKYKGGVLFVDSADKAARFIWLCDAFNIPLVYLADVPGFMIGTKVERA